MVDADVETQVRAIAGSALGMDLTGVSLTSHLLKDLGMDSLTSIDTLCRLEDEFHFTIDESNPPRLTDLQDLVTFVQLHVKPELTLG